LPRKRAISSRQTSSQASGRPEWEENEHNKSEKIIIKLLERQPLIIKDNNNKNILDQQRYGMLCNHITRKALGNSKSHMNGY
jgi:hypothetical protein